MRRSTLADHAALLLGRWTRVTASNRHWHASPRVPVRVRVRVGVGMGVWVAVPMRAVCGPEHAAASGDVRR